MGKKLTDITGMVFLTAVIAVMMIELLISFEISRPDTQMISKWCNNHGKIVSVTPASHITDELYVVCSDGTVKIK